MFSSVRLREVFFAVGTREMVSASAYGRCPFMGGYKYRVFLRKRPGLQNGVRLQGVSAYKGCPLGGVRLYSHAAHFVTNSLVLVCNFPTIT